MEIVRWNSLEKALCVSQTVGTASERVWLKGVKSNFPTGEED